MKNALIGNGLNIELGGPEYCNSGIINRLFNNLRTKDWSDIFAKKITGEDLLVILNGLCDDFTAILKGKYDNYCKTYDEKSTLDRIKKQYDINTNKSGIGMEDYFFILKLFHNRYNDPPEISQATFDGMCFLLLDAIYNEGRIQNIHEGITIKKKDKLQSVFGQFDNIFTVNYDCNIEMISKKSVYYLHGDFNTLHDQYNPESLIGRMCLDRGIPNPVNDKTKHIYCNGIMGFTGSQKEEVMRYFENAQYGISQIITKMTNGLSAEDEEVLERMRLSPYEIDKFKYGVIQTKRKFPLLAFHQYPRKEFMEISDELSIVGLSPNNDDHIWGMLKQNSELQKIIYYYKSKQDKDAVHSLYPNMKIKTIPVEEFWESV